MLEQVSPSPGVTSQTPVKPELVKQHFVSLLIVSAEIAPSTTKTTVKLIPIKAVVRKKNLIGHLPLNLSVYYCSGGDGQEQV
jgi:hypothetical protein